MLNLDMVGYLRGSRLDVSGTGTAGEFPALVDQFGSRHGMRISKDPSGYGPSDHASFYGKGVPVLHFFTGFHDHYHRPSDDAERLNIAGMRRIAEMVTEMIVKLANRPAPPERARDPYAAMLAELTGSPTRSRRNQAGRGQASDSQNTSGNAAPQTTSSAVRAELGLHGEASTDGRSVRVLGVARGSLAARAGLRVGDQLVQVNRRAVGSIEELQQLLDAAGAEAITIRFRRGSVDFETELVSSPR
jgi:hypothetical protein